MLQGIIRGVGPRCRRLVTGQTVQYESQADDGDLEKGYARKYVALSAGQYSGTTNITLNAKVIAMENACAIDQNTGLMWMKNTPDSDIGPSTNGKLFWKQWTLAGKTDISFASGTKKINSVAGEFSTSALRVGRKFTVAGSSSNDGTYTVAGVTANDITTSESLADEAATASITIATDGDLIWDFCSGANTQSLAGHADWRVPNVFELFSLIVHDVGISAPFINTTYFQCLSDNYFSSTTAPSDTAAALFVRFANGRIDGNVKGTFMYYVRLVRGG